MVTLLITSLFILALLAIATYFWQKPRRTSEAKVLTEAPGRGLFVDGALEDSPLLPTGVEPDSESAATKRGALLERVAAGEQSTLLEAHQADAELYQEALNSFVATADTKPKLLSLVSYVTRHDLPVNKELAEAIIDSYKPAPDRSSTAKMLHATALSNDAAVYQAAVEVALQCWRDGRLPEVSAVELRSILEGEFWILSSSTRSSGAGFLLKRTLQNARRELEAAQNSETNSTPNTLN